LLIGHDESRKSKSRSQIKLKQAKLKWKFKINKMMKAMSIVNEHIISSLYILDNNMIYENIISRYILLIFYSFIVMYDLPNNKMMK